MCAQLEDRDARLWLSLCTRPGDPLVGELVAAFGAVKLRQVLTADSSLTLQGRLGAHLKKLRASKLVLPTEGHLQRTVERISRAGLHVLAPLDKHWPASLNDLGAKAPLLMFLRGNPQVLGRIGRNVAVVGTRTPSEVAMSAAREISWHQICAGRTIVSGGAKGIDAVGHLVSLESGVPTIAVLAQSPDRPYPPEHRGMCNDIARHGVVVSEVPPGVHHGAKGFLARNRLIAALATLTIVVEAPVRSGAISTAAHAAHLDREVMAVLYEDHEAYSGSTRARWRETASRQFHGDNRGSERIIEQWAGHPLYWPLSIHEKA